jgi:transcription initiation factor IIE alpha subunit
MTDELTLETIATLTGINPKSLKNTLFRLTSAGVIIRADQKIGRGGWVKYQINSEIIEQIQQADFLSFTKIKR